eukprot:6353984-Amphidinium_carterae.2
MQRSIAEKYFVDALPDAALKGKSCTSDQKKVAHMCLAYCVSLGLVSCSEDCFRPNRPMRGRGP